MKVYFVEEKQNTNLKLTNFSSIMFGTETAAREYIKQRVEEVKSNSRAVFIGTREEDLEYNLFELGFEWECSGVHTQLTIKEGEYISAQDTWSQNYDED